MVNKTEKSFSPKACRKNFNNDFAISETIFKNVATEALDRKN